jgi:hypothetical protein
MTAPKDLTNRIEIGQKHIRSEDRQNNVKVTKGLIRDQFVAADVSALSHGPGMIFDFESTRSAADGRDADRENSIRQVPKPRATSSSKACSGWTMNERSILRSSPPFLRQFALSPMSGPMRMASSTSVSPIRRRTPTVFAN